MKGIHMTKHKVTIIACLFLGILALIVGSTSLSKRSHYVPVKATITRIEENYDITQERYDCKTFAEYRVDGKKYEGDIGYYKDGFKEGKVIEIRYNPNDPTKIEAASAGVLIYFVIIGAILTAAGFFMLMRRK